MRVVTGTDTGLMKVVDVVKGEVLITIGEQKKGKGLKKIQWASETNDTEVVSLYDDSQIDFYWISTGQRRFSMVSSLNNIQGMYCETTSEDTRNVYVCNNQGMLHIYNFPISKYNLVQPSDDFLANLEKNEDDGLVNQQLGSDEDDDGDDEKPKKRLNPTLGYKVTEDAQTHKITIEPKVTELKLTGGDVSTMVAQRLDSKRLEIAIAGKDNLMKIWDVETQKCVFKAKNVPHDHLNLKQPIWDNGICYLGSSHPDSERMEAMGDAFGNLICNRTAYHQVRYFDRRAQERPVHQYYFEEHNFTAMCPSTVNVHEVVVGTAIGKMFKYNFQEKKNKKINVYRRIAGSVRDIKFHPNKKVVCCVSADRYLRVYDQESRQMLHSSYLLQRLNCLLLTKDRYVNKDDEDEENSEDDDGMFGMNMKQVSYEEDIIDEDEDESPVREQPKKRKLASSSPSGSKKTSSSVVNKLDDIKNRIKKSKLK
ncbi:predicted protein [Naegleria gruberi]|uniref:Predicted protein n=1 Tax=Naegleria gruberi TaxID=5762 RepID=D2VLI5_NAEGR|nr:uncharacterized protein NAEGRDRAFT_69791 [Naegleria gruberi]EFC42317.1 predicted protein [Naegleria gruberi]|eukprot:XP_002675061.1 predicted protein [Naegleria gruberi strain NEG-M]